VVFSVALGGYWFYKVSTALSTQARTDIQQLMELEDAFAHISGEFSAQTQEWKNILLRAHDPVLLQKHKQAFHLHQQLFHGQLFRAQHIVQEAQLNGRALLEIERREEALLLAYAQAIKQLNPQNPNSFHAVDAQVRGIDHELNIFIRDAQEKIEEEIASKLMLDSPTNNHSGAFSTYQLALGLLALLLPLGALTAFFFAFRNLRKIAHSDSRINTIFRSIGDALLVTDAQGRVESLNPQAQQLTGWSEVEARGLKLESVFQIFDAHTHLTVESPASIALRTGKAQAVSNGVNLRRRDGSEVSIEENATPIQNRAGVVFGAVMSFRDVSQRRAMLHELEQQQHLFQQTFEQAAVGMAHLTPDGHWLRVNQKLCDITGYSATELLTLSFTGITHPDDVERDVRQVNLLFSNHLEQYQAEKRYLKKNGQFVWVSITVSVVWNTDGTPNFGVSIIEDIQARKVAEQLAVTARQQYQTLFEQMPEGVVILDEQFKIIAHNQEALNQLEYSSAELLTMSLQDFKLDAGSALEDEQRFAQITLTGRADYEAQYRSRTGNVMFMDVSVARVSLPDGNTAYQAVFNDITEQRNIAAQVEFLAYHDQLTGLPNRRLLHDRLTQSLSSAKRSATQLAIIYLDLDHFKDINDSLGHQVGDELLQEVARRLQACVRKEDTLARMGGDEFVIMLNQISDEHAAAHVAEKILHEIARPIQLGSHELRISPSLGISLFPQDGHDAETLLKHADAALYQAKHAGRATYRYYTQALHTQSLERLKLERLMPRALERQQFELYYQAQVDLLSGRIVGCEALIRWNHPDMGMIMPARFIPVAEHSHLINKIGLWVMREACLQAKRWQDAGLNLQVSFNVSARQFMQAGEFNTALYETLNETGVNPELLVIELTESLLLFSQGNNQLLQDIANLGVRIALDDFGTGYSSLSYLRRLPIDHLKIDQSFVSHIENNDDDAEMVKTIIGMAHNLKMSVVAEGVETAAQVAQLTALGCEVAQGYYYSRPVPVLEFEQRLRASNPPA
jgi:diguanylate cyclase (GGDEF)-like protein/PAS domain S-box-containing protein